MANPEHLIILKQGVKAWNKWRKENPNIIPDLRRAELSFMDLGGAHLRRVIGYDAGLISAKLSRAQLSESDLRRSDLSWANLTGAKLDGADLSEANLHGAQLSEAELLETDLSWTRLTEANLCGADLRLADLRGANLRGANLSGANLYGANLFGTNLSKADLSNANLSETDLVSANLSGVKLTGANLRKANLKETNLCKIDLIKADLSRANLSKTDLSGANLSEASLRQAKIKDAYLSEVNLHMADIQEADLTGTDLSGANLSNANLCKANLYGVILCGDETASMANIADANLTEITFTPEGEPIDGASFLDLSMCFGLESAKFSKSGFLQEYLTKAFEYAHRIDTYEAKKWPDFLDRAIKNIKALRTIYADRHLPKQLIEVVHIITAELLKYLKKHPKALYKIKPRQFEELVAEILASYKWDVQLTPPVKDGGYDIFAISKDIKPGLQSSWIIECKKYQPEHKVGVDIVRALYGVKSDLRVANALLATTSYFTKGAKAFKSSRYDVDLKDYRNILEWINKYRPNPKGTLYIKENRLIVPSED